MSTLSDMHLKETRHLITDLSLVKTTGGVSATREVLAITHCGLGNNTIVISDDEQLICQNCVRMELDREMPQAPRDVLCGLAKILFPNETWHQLKHRDFAWMLDSAKRIMDDYAELRKLKATK